MGTSRAIPMFESVIVWLIGILIVIPVWRLMLVLRGNQPTRTYKQEFTEFSHITLFIAFFAGQLLCIAFDKATEGIPQLGLNTLLRWFLIWLIFLVPSAVIPPGIRRRAVIASAIAMVPLEFFNRNGLTDLLRLLPEPISFGAIVSCLIAFLGAFGIAYWVDKVEANQKAKRDPSIGA